MKKRTVRRFISALFLLCLGAGAHAGPAAPPASTQDHPLVSLEPPVNYLEPGALCTLRVMVNDAVDSLSCMGVYVNLDDTAVVDVTIAREGLLFRTSGYQTFFYWKRILPDSVIAEDCVLGYRSYFLAPGELVQLVFRAKALGVCNVSLAAARLWDINRVELAPVTGESAEIVVRYPTGHDAPASPTGAFSNYPNPFNPATVLVMELPGHGGPEMVPVGVAIDIYDVSGVRVRSLFRGFLPPGRRQIIWDGRDGQGRPSAAGIYLAVAETAAGTLKRKMVLLR
jgi:hypothetical protein